MRARLVVALLVSLVGFGCGGASDDDGDDGVCQGESCAGCSSDTQCQDDPDFGPGARCVDRACVAAECVADDGCSGGQVCDEESFECRDCVDMDEDDRCGEGAACVDGVCTADACNIDEQCSDPDLCIDHRCGCEVSTTCEGGLCSDEMVCEACVDPDDDAACQAEYGPGRLCIAGSCIPADCRGDGECEGAICCDNLCTGNQCCGTGDDERCDAIVPGFVCDAGGSCVCPPAVAGTVAVSNSGSDDPGFGNGSAVCPVRSITRALELAAGDPSATVTIQVSAGSYSEADGETMPILVNRTGIVLTGAGIGVSILGNDSAGPLLRLDQPATVSGFTMVNGAPSPAIVDVRAGGQISNALIVGASGGIAACVVGNGGGAAELGPSVVIRQCDTGVTVNAGADLTISGEVRQNGTGVLVNSGGVVRIMGGSIHQNDGNGVTLDDASVSNPTSIFDGAQIFQNGGNGVLVAQNSRLEVRNSTIVGNAGNGVRAAGASVQLDLGTLAEPGGNILNRSEGGNGRVGLCNLTGRTLDAVSDIWSTCPPTVGASCLDAGDINQDVNAANCASQ
jgi:hypothetical protein